MFFPLTVVGSMMGILFNSWAILAIMLMPVLSAKLLRYTMTHKYKGIGVVYKSIDSFLLWLKYFSI